MKDLKLREEMLTYVRKLTDSGWLVATSGNMSYRNKEDNTFLITPSGIDYQEMKPEDIFVIDADGNIVEGSGTGKPTSSLAFHKMVLDARPECNVVLHTHAPYATAASLVVKEVPAVTYPAFVYLGGAIPVAPFADNGSMEEATNITNAIGKTKNAVLMENHGAVAVGKSLEDAWMNMAHLEECCQIWAIAKSTGMEPTSL